MLTHCGTKRLEATEYMLSMYTRLVLLKFCWDRSVTVCIYIWVQKWTPQYMICLPCNFSNRTTTQTAQYWCPRHDDKTDIRHVNSGARGRNVNNNNSNSSSSIESSYKNAWCSWCFSSPTECKHGTSSRNERRNIFQPHRQQQQSTMRHSAFLVLQATIHRRNAQPVCVRSSHAHKHARIQHSWYQETPGLVIFRLLSTTVTTEIWFNTDNATFKKRLQHSPPLPTQLQNPLTNTSVAKASVTLPHGKN